MPLRRKFAVTTRVDYTAFKWVLLAEIVLVAIKLWGYLSSSLLSVLAELVNSSSDIVLILMMLLGFRFSMKPADEEHPYGHERAQSVVALVGASLFVFFVAFQLVESAVGALQGGDRVYGSISSGQAVLLASMLVRFIPVAPLYRQRQQPIMKTQLIDLLNDEATLTGALVSTQFVASGQLIADPVIALVIACIIAINSVLLIRENFGILVGKSPGAKWMEKVRRIACRTQGVLGVHDMKAEYLGPRDIHLDIHICVSPQTHVSTGDRIAESLERSLEERLGVTQVTVHVDPVHPRESCRVCESQTCEMQRKPEDEVRQGRST